MPNIRVADIMWPPREGGGRFEKLIDRSAQVGNAAFAEKYGFPYRLLSDPTRALALAWGAADSAEDQYARRITYLVGAGGLIERAIETDKPAEQAAEIRYHMRWTSLR